MNRVRLFFLMRYLFAGGVAFVTNLILLFVFAHYFHLWYLTASTFAFIVSVIVSFMMQKFVTFRDRTTERIHHQVVMFIGIALFNMTANGAIMFSFVDLRHIPYMIAQVFSSGFIALWSLMVYRYIIFKHASIS